jgi:HD-GYP domain-containing protein (c-di-GMP phosphodiesterase class II)
MLSILNILKKHQDERKKTAASGGPSGKSDACVGTGANHRVSISSALLKEPNSEQAVHTQEMYLQCLSVTDNLYQRGGVRDPDLKEKITHCAESLVRELSDGSYDIVLQALKDYPSEAFMSRHALNVAIFSIEIGLGLGFAHQSLVPLAVSCLVHDVGSAAYLDLIYKSSVFTPEERTAVREHPMHGPEVLHQVGGFSAEVVEAIGQEHERLDGSGYPKGLKDAHICEYAQIIGLADVYEAMTHARPYRVKYAAADAMQALLNAKQAFSSKLMKMLIERIGIFPLGSLVRLNTKEVARVIAGNSVLPLRPAVQVLLDAQGKEMQQAKDIDLARNPLIYIEECLDCLKKTDDK